MLNKSAEWNEQKLGMGYRVYKKKKKTKLPLRGIDFTKHNFCKVSFHQLQNAVYLISYLNCLNKKYNGPFVL